MKRLILSTAALLIFAMILPSCGKIKGARHYPLPRLFLETPSDEQSEDVEITYRFVSAENNTYNIEVFYSIDGGASFSPAAEGSGGEGINGLAASPDNGTTHTFIWSSAADGVAANSAVTTCVIKIAPAGNIGTPGVTDAFTVNNSGVDLPPAKVTNPSPSDNASDVPTTAGLGWDAAPRATSYNVYFGTTSPPALECAGCAATSFAPGALTYETTYYWQVDSANSVGDTTGDIWSFVTEAESTSPPDGVTGPSPTDGAGNISITADLSWSASSGATGYHVFFGTTDTPPHAAETGNTSYNPGPLDYSTTYYWEIVAYNTHGNASAALWSFTTEDEFSSPPGEPMGPYPENGAGNVSVTVDLTWQAANRAQGYYVYFGDTSPPPFADNVTACSYDPGILDIGTIYYWQIIAYNPAGNTSGAEWLFSTSADTNIYMTWEQKSTAHSPPARFTHNLAWNGDNVVLFGGSTGGFDLSDETWTWDGDDWTQESPADSPSARAGHAMCQYNDGVLLFGGLTFALIIPVLEDDTWLYSDGNWTQIITSNTLPERFYSTMVYDSSENRVILFGGGTFSSAYRDTWIFNGTNWIRQIGQFPPARGGNGMALVGVPVIFGGSASGVFSDTWTFNGTDWNNASSTSPGMIYAMAMTHSLEADYAVMHGGQDAGDAYLDATWHWNGVEWQEAIITASKPSPRGKHAMAYDPAHHEFIIFGGEDDDGPIDETWVLKKE
jgi:hypothetical protein